MKKILISLATLILIPQQSFTAIGLPGATDLRLRLKVEAIEATNHGTIAIPEINITGDNRISAIRCREERCENVFLGFLSESRRAFLEDQIQAAKEAAIHWPENDARKCRALPTERFFYTADNGTVILRAGTRPCGRISYRDGREVQELVDLLDRLETYVLHGDPMGEIQELID